MHDAWTKATCVCTFSPVAKHLIDGGRSAGTCTMVHVCTHYRTHMILYIFMPCRLLEHVARHVARQLTISILMLLSSSSYTNSLELPMALVLSFFFF